MFARQANEMPFATITEPVFRPYCEFDRPFSDIKLPLCYSSYAHTGQAYHSIYVTF